MESPMDDESASTSSSGTPPPEDGHYIPTSMQSSTLAAMFAQTATNDYTQPAPGKRRLPGGTGFGASMSNRDAKSRRREETGGRRGGNLIGGSGGGWQEGKERTRKEDELVDVPLAEILKKQFGDPFNDTIIKNNS
ncbi:hypothetical protein JAAARDRAFT_30574 [Jaapia argillacea MUCL 33604]|uniref:Uncharacterized protein n=1 Tax=Jaapia argillacea MUCL 33604 TaxID=933084 RepID=A0A067QGM7_9AGAM|nr:hypothetical protein JAAARDRAFT_30574 [Jaapia argillacea MUCL 33604]